MFVTAPRGSSLNARGDDFSGERSTTARDANSRRSAPLSARAALSRVSCLTRLVIVEPAKGPADAG